ncbi:MAG: 3-phosphoshikimate 1-carboxyvinyltransferase [Pirellulales bacterium]
MPDSITISPVTSPVIGCVRPPGSKSITNRALVCAALASGRSTLTGTLDSDDTRVMVQCLRTLGIVLDGKLGDASLDVTGCDALLRCDHVDLFAANSGTTIRFLTAVAAAGHGNFRLDGVERMRQRPIQDLVDGLVQLNVDIRCESGNGCPPVVVNAKGLDGGSLVVRGNVSSQYLSALLMVAPAATGPMEIRIEGPLVSRPYVDMTCRVMQSFGVETERTDASHFRIEAPQTYQGCNYDIEPDASAASYFWAVAAVTGGEVTVEGLRRDSLQGDVRFCDCLEQMGCSIDYLENGITVRGGRERGSLRGIEVDMSDISDTVQTLAVVALHADGPTTIRGVGHIRHKETDRIGDLATELRKLGAEVTELPDGLRIEPAAIKAAVIETYDDHRMAMSLALAGLRTPGVQILDPDCTAKTYPGYFIELAALLGQNFDAWRAG